MMRDVRILLVSDLHYALRQLDWVASVGPDHDLVVLAGDLVDLASAVPVEAQIVALSTYLERLADRVPVVVASGNHDLDGRDSAGEKAALWIRALRHPNLVSDGGALEVGGALVTVCPWWDGPVGREAVAEQLAADAGRGGRPWIWVYHWPPDESRLCWTGSRHYGDPDLVGWIREHQPDLVLTGHVHEPPFRAEGSWADRVDGSWVFNPGQQIGPEPCRIVIDLEESSARWWSLIGEEEVDLAGPPPPSPRPV
jgi:Icc-related predicted phosphoesterase